MAKDNRLPLKIIVRKKHAHLEKQNFALRFSRNQCYYKKMKFPLSSAIVQPIVLKTLRVLWLYLGVPFCFSLNNIVPMKFGSLYKIRSIEKNTLFNSNYLQYFASREP